jgi:replicative DNA helicase
MDAAGGVLVAATGNEPTSEILSDLANAVYELSQGTKKHQAGENIGGFIPQILDEIRQREPGRLTGVSLGLGKTLDDALDGLHPGEMIVVGARPSIGKSAFATQVACHVAQHNGPVALFSLEMTRRQLIERIIAGEADVDTTELRTNKLVGPDREKVKTAARRLKNVPLIIDDRRGMAPDQIMMAAKQYAMRHGELALILVDYLQIVAARTQQSTYERVSEAAAMCQRIAGELNAPVMALSQVSRETAKGDHVRRPVVADLKSSGAIEECADVVILLHRQDQYRQNPAEYDFLADVHVAKSRHGRTEMCHMSWRQYCQRFVPHDAALNTRNDPQLTLSDYDDQIAETTA